MADKKKKSVLDSFMKSPGASSLKEAADLLSQTVNHSDGRLTDHTGNQKSQQVEEAKESRSSVADSQKDLTKQITEQPTSQITTQTITDEADTSEVFFLNENEALLYTALKRNVGCFTTVKRIAKVLGKSEHTMRKCLKRLVKMGLVRYERDNLRNQQGIRIVEVRDVPVKVLGDRSRVEQVLKEALLEKIAFESEITLFK